MLLDLRDEAMAAVTVDFDALVNPEECRRETAHRRPTRGRP
jgi:hypothetical protein